MAHSVLGEWIERLRAKAQATGWPDKATAFRPGRRCTGATPSSPAPTASPVQRIVHATHELNDCARCQAGGRLLVGRALSKLPKASWPLHVDHLSWAATNDSRASASDLRALATDQAIGPPAASHPRSTA
jgi:formamidopyrimidine-DNA glycosylase